jgi:signal transduction histidine kinase
VLLIGLLEDCARDSSLRRPDVPVTVYVRPERLVVEVDPDRFRQIITNLVANAARMSPPGASVEISASVSESRVTVTVADVGPGIAPEDADHVFERFYRADAARQSDSGAGLGLAIVKWLVDLHGGSIRHEPNRPTGCRMILEVPRGEP